MGQRSRPVESMEVAAPVAGGSSPVALKGRRLAVIVPIHNEAINIRPFYLRAQPALDGIPDVASWQIVFCDNGSSDESLDEVLRLRDADARVKVITLSKNFGYHSSLVAGLSSVDADLYAMIDVDCEDPPELLPTFHQAIVEGAELAYGIRSQRDEPRVVTVFRRAFYALNRRVADSEIIMWMAEFSMMTRQVRDAILVPHTTFPFIRAEMGYVGFARVGVPYRRARRERGASHYNLFTMTKFAVAGILSRTTFPLRLTAYAAFVLATAYPLIVWVMHYTMAEAAQLATVMSFYFLLVSIPCIGLYVARTYRNGIHRPVYIIDWHRTQLD